MKNAGKKTTNKCTDCGARDFYHFFMPFVYLSDVRADSVFFPQFFNIMLYKYGIMFIVWLKRIETPKNCKENAFKAACEYHLTWRTNREERRNNKQKRTCLSKRPTNHTADSRFFLLNFFWFSAVRLCFVFNNESIKWQQQLIWPYFGKWCWLVGVPSWRENHGKRQWCN